MKEIIKVPAIFRNSNSRTITIRPSLVEDIFETLLNLIFFIKFDANAQYTINARQCRHDTSTCDAKHKLNNNYKFVFLKVCGLFYILSQWAWFSM